MRVLVNTPACTEPDGPVSGHGNLRRLRGFKGLADQRITQALQVDQEALVYLDLVVCRLSDLELVPFRGDWQLVPDELLFNDHPRRGPVNVNAVWVVHLKSG